MAQRIDFSASCENVDGRKEAADFREIRRKLDGKWIYCVLFVQIN